MSCAYHVFGTIMNPLLHNSVCILEEMISVLVLNDKYNRDWNEAINSWQHITSLLKCCSLVQPNALAVMLANWTTDIVHINIRISAPSGKLVTAIPMF